MLRGGALSLFRVMSRVRPDVVCLMSFCAKLWWHFTGPQMLGHLEDVQGRDTVLERVLEIELLDVSHLLREVKDMAPLLHHAF